MNTTTMPDGRQLAPGDILAFNYRDKRFMARAIQLVTGSDYTHAATYLGDGKVGEACSHGYQVSELAHYFADCLDIAVLHFPGTPAQADDVVDYARAIAHSHLRYGWLDVIALGLAHYGIRPELVLRRLRTPRTAFCSQACARLWTWAGVDIPQLIGRPDYEVTPADLARIARGE